MTPFPLPSSFTLVRSLLPLEGAAVPVQSRPLEESPQRRLAAEGTHRRSPCGFGIIVIRVDLCESLQAEYLREAYVLSIPHRLVSMSQSAPESPESLFLAFDRFPDDVSYLRSLVRSLDFREMYLRSRAVCEENGLARPFASSLLECVDSVLQLKDTDVAVASTSLLASPRAPASRSQRTDRQSARVSQPVFPRTRARGADLS